MYDTIFINKEMLPVSDEDKKRIPDNNVWQTKSFDNDMSEYYITDDGGINQNIFQYESVPKEERPYPNDNGILGLAGSIRKIDEKIVPIEYHGIVKFYSNVDKEWFEFEAKFTDGKLINIKRNKQ